MVCTCCAHSLRIIAPHHDRRYIRLGDPEGGRVAHQCALCSWRRGDGVMLLEPGSFTMAVNATLIQNVPMTQFNATQPTMAILGSGLWLQNASAVFLQPPSISSTCQKFSPHVKYFPYSDLNMPLPPHTIRISFHGTIKLQPQSTCRGHGYRKVNVT